MGKSKKRKANVYIIKCKYKKCGKSFTCYHKSRKFCSNSNCKDCHNNEKKLASYHRNKFGVKFSDDNWMIISFLTRKGNTRTNAAELDRLGFDFDVFIDHQFTEEQIQKRQGDSYVFAGFSLKVFGNNEFEIQLD